MAHTLQLEINNHRYQLVNSVTDGTYFVEVNPQRRLFILLSILLILLVTYFYQIFTQPGLDFSQSTRVEQVIREKHLNIDTSIPVEPHQHPVYLYYDNVDIVKTFLPSGHERL